MEKTKTLTVKEMYKTLYEDTQKAKELYKDKYVQITGKVGSIDYYGLHFTLIDTTDNKKVYNEILCTVHSADELDLIKSFGENTKIMVYGKIDSVHKELGISLKVGYIDRKFDTVKELSDGEMLSCLYFASMS